jgi:hypothetical protein
MLLEYVISSTPKMRIQFKGIEPAIKEKVNFLIKSSGEIAIILIFC